jgi:hypothetical protein
MTPVLNSQTASVKLKAGSQEVKTSEEASIVFFHQLHGHRSREKYVSIQHIPGNEVQCLLIPMQYERKPMEADKNSTEAAGTETRLMEGTKGMQYWQFKKEICTDKGWQLRRIEPQVYEVIDGKREKIGVFQSGEGYFPTLKALQDIEESSESA